MDLFKRRNLTIVIIVALLGFGVIYKDTKLYTQQLTMSSWPKGFLSDRSEQGMNTNKSQQSFGCNVHVVSDISNSGLEKIQKERKSRIKKVCDMCRKNRSSMECNHVTMGGDYRGKIMYQNLIADEKHKVVLFYIVTLNDKKISRQKTDRRTDRETYFLEELAPLF